MHHPRRSRAANWTARLVVLLAVCLGILNVSIPTAQAADVAAPEVVEFDYSPKYVDTSTEAQIITITARITDETGLGQAPAVWLKSLTTTQSLWANPSLMELISGTAQDGIYQARIIIPTTAAPGTWQVMTGSVSDIIGNSAGMDVRAQFLQVFHGLPDHPGPVWSVELKIQGQQLHLTWEPPHYQGKAPVTGYHISGLPGGKTVDTYATSLTVDAGSWGAEIFSVQAVNDFGRGEPVTLRFYTPAVPATTVPSAPTNLFATVATSQPTIFWDPPSSDGGAVVTGYKVVATPGGKSIVVSAPATKATFPGLTAGVTYRFRVHAINRVGAGPASTSSNAVTPTSPAKPVPAPEPEKPFDVYTAPGTHHINGRDWRTTCQKYSSTVTRCTTEIRATQVSQGNGVFVQTNGWVFNNLTYVASPRGQWKTNPLAANGVVGGKVSWTADDGRKWRTECDTSTTGRNGCRSYVQARIIESYTTSTGDRAFRWVTKEIFNNMVRFK